MTHVIEPITTLFEIRNREAMAGERPLSTLAFDWLYVTLGLLLTVGLMMDVWSHLTFGPDQSLFNEYHLLFYGSMSALLLLLSGLLYTNWRAGYPLGIALPQGYGAGLLATLLFAFAGVIDLTGHALFGFESDLEALTSPTHLLLFINWFLILFAPVAAARSRIAATGQPASFKQSLPMMLAFGCMIACVYIPMMFHFPLGTTKPVMLQMNRPDNDVYGLIMGISGTFLQTLFLLGFALWLVREFKMPRFGFMVVFGFYGLFLTLLQAWQMPWLMFGLFGLSLDIFYGLLRPDGTRRIQYITFAILGTITLWAIGYGTFAFILDGANTFYYSGYNLYGSIAQATTLAVLLAYLMSMPAPQNRNKFQETHHA